MRVSLSNLAGFAQGKEKVMGVIIQGLHKQDAWASCLRLGGSSSVALHHRRQRGWDEEVTAILRQPCTQCAACPAKEKPQVYSFQVQYKASSKGHGCPNEKSLILAEPTAGHVFGIVCLDLTKGRNSLETAGHDVSC